MSFSCYDPLLRQMSFRSTTKVLLRPTRNRLETRMNQGVALLRHSATNVQSRRRSVATTTLKGGCAATAAPHRPSPARTRRGVPPRHPKTPQTSIAARSRRVERHDDAKP
jgi:hypothetical protein